MAGAATLLSDTLTNSGALRGRRQADAVADRHARSLAARSTITAPCIGTIIGGTIDVTGDSTIGSADLNNGDVTVASGVTLTLDNDTVTGTTFTDTASGAILSVDGGTR